ncbi:hypothetical protein AYI70_g981 [Smittium culicis]|uniref:Uncharacterized protein n=1 Tax=Smittium culicis TaxID=133412 RepID=A0A1R1YEK1_9FUNG|nr:hypothetical protein AYI70_g981 [Smittium culicis]
MDQHYMQIIQDLSDKVNATNAQREHQGINQEQTMGVVAPQDIIYGCPKFIPMNYQPPPLNDAAPPNVKKTD